MKKALNLKYTLCDQIYRIYKQAKFSMARKIIAVVACKGWGWNLLGRGMRKLSS